MCTLHFSCFIYEVSKFQLFLANNKSSRINSSPNCIFHVLKTKILFVYSELLNVNLVYGNKMCFLCIKSLVDEAFPTPTKKLNQSTRHRTTFKCLFFCCISIFDLGPFRTWARWVNFEVRTGPTVHRGKFI